MATKNPYIHWVQYIGARFITLILGLFPVNANLGSARLLGSLWWHVMKKHRMRAMTNLRASFPEKSDAELIPIAKRSLQHFMELVMDTFFTPRLIHVETYHKFVHLNGLESTLRHILHQRGAIMITGHYGNWEVLGFTMATLGFETYSIARPIDNPHIDQWLLGVRERRGQIILSKRGVTATAQDVLAKRGVLAALADQDAGRKGLLVPFFGRPASTYKSFGLWAMEYQVPIIVGYARRRQDTFEFDIGISDIIHPEDWQNQPNELRYITERYTAAIEKFVREDPTQYLWIHRRWKTRPKEEMAGTVAGVG
jgi:Kdo2-lipid IVA lauroyltransferase/acyltransferase